MTVSEGFRASGAMKGRRGRVRPQDVEDARAACRSAVAMFERAGLISGTVAKTAIIVIQGARPCKSGGLVNASQAWMLAGMRGKIRKDVDCTTQTIRRHVNALSEAGLVIDRTKGGGGRGYARGYLYGIDVSPLLGGGGDTEASSSRHWTDLLARGEARSALVGLMTPLRQLAGRAGEATSNLLDEVVHRAVELRDTIPRRYEKLTTAAIQRLIAAIEDLLAVAARRTRGAGDDLGRTEMFDPSKEPVQPTYTEDKSICRSGAGKDEEPADDGARRATRPHGPETHRKAGRQDDRTCDIAASDVLTLLPNGTWETIEGCYRELGQRGARLAIREASTLMWHDAGGDEASRRRVIDALGAERGAMLLMLVAAQSRSGRIRDVAAYAVSCAQRAADGAFMWGAALRSAGRQRRRGTPAPVC